MSSSTTLPGVHLSRAALVRLIGSVFNPNPEDSGRPRGPLDPIGPVSRTFRDISWAMLNPQPLPPVAGPQPDPWRWSQVALNPQPVPPVAGPHPDPWRAAFDARTVVDQAIGLFRAGEMSGGEHAERAFEGARGMIRSFVDDYCGTGPRRWPRPWPSPLSTDFRYDPVELVFAGALFQKAADATPDSPLQSDFSAAADQLLETGLSQMS